MKAGPLNIYGMEAFDVEGVCFSMFSTDDWLAGHARLYLEGMIQAAGCEYISPANIYTAFFHASQVLNRNLPPDIREAKVAEIMAERRKRLAERGIFPPKLDIWAGTGLDEHETRTSTRTAKAADLAF